MKKAIEDQNVFRSEFKVIQEVNDRIQRNISYIKDELQNSIENNLQGRRKKGKSFWSYGDGLKELLTMNPTEKD